MIELAFEVWRSEAGDSLGCFLPNSRNDTLFQTLSPDARVVHVIYGSSTDEVMARYYAWNGWGDWTPVAGVTGQPWTAEQLNEQMALRPAYYEIAQP